MQSSLIPSRIRANLRRDMVLGFALVNMLLALWLVNTLWNSHAAYERTASSATQNMAVSMDQSISASVSGIDLTLYAVTDFMEERLRGHGPLKPAEINAYLRQSQARLPYLNGIRATNAEGRVVFGTDVDPLAGASWQDRDFFATLRDYPQSGLVVGNPVYGKVTKKWMLPFVRRYNDSQGRFAGVISAAIPVDYFNGLLQSLDVGPRGIALLRDSNLGLIARGPRTAAASGQIGAKGFLRNWLPAGPVRRANRQLTRPEHLRPGGAHQHLPAPVQAALSPGHWLGHGRLFGRVAGGGTPPQH